MTRSFSKLPRRRFPESPWCVRRAEAKALKLLAYEVIRLSIAKEDGAGRDELTRSRHVSAQDESGAYGQEKLRNNELCRSSGLVRSS